MSIFKEYPDLCDADYVQDYDFLNCPTRRDLEGPVYDLDVAAALIRFEGNISRTASALGRSRRLISSMISRNINLGDLQEDIMAEFIDAVEDEARKIAKAGDRGMVKFLLGTQGRDRGYVTRQETTGKDGNALEVQFYLPENGRDLPKETDSAEE
ncbi:MAG: hypothetical protein CMP20_04030 [Rickettsiales bacterium]|nr:hypothetical protein [Rickettsiales bacterium]|tara:strand:- start:7979 stop:8443 length:465 start_codon:yes stop_codon:yes gene_type:complete